VGELHRQIPCLSQSSSLKVRLSHSHHLTGNFTSSICKENVERRRTKVAMSDIEKNASPTGPSPDSDTEKVGEVAGPQDPKTMLKHADRNDADEALKIFEGHLGETIVLTPEEEKKLLRKIDWNIIPLMCIVYGLNYLDKTTVSYASIMGLKVGKYRPCKRRHRVRIIWPANTNLDRYQSRGAGL